MLKVDELKEVLKTAVRDGSFPANAIKLSGAIVGYVKAKGTAKSPTISYTLGPANGLGWTSLIPMASSKGVADYIISHAITTEFASSLKVIPAHTGVITVPMSFNSAAKVGDMSKMTDYDQVWEEISHAIIEFFKPEIE